MYLPDRTANISASAARCQQRPRFYWDTTTASGNDRRTVAEISIFDFGVQYAGVTTPYAVGRSAAATGDGVVLEGHTL